MLKWEFLAVYHRYGGPSSSKIPFGLFVRVIGTDRPHPSLVVLSWHGSLFTDGSFQQNSRFPMARRHSHRIEGKVRSLSVRQRAALTPSARPKALRGKRMRGGQRNEQLPFAPPEDWHEPAEEVLHDRDPYDFRIVEQPPGPGYRHVLQPDEIRARLRELPPSFVEPLEVVQLSRMTRKKERFSCYGMQWGCALFLYPLEEDRIETHCRPPKPSQRIEAQMYGGRWVQDAFDSWRLIWSEDALKDFYLNNILIHELGHLLDERNTSYVDRERYAEWFALEYGYKMSDRLGPEKRRRVVRRHHAS